MLTGIIIAAALYLIYEAVSAIKNAPEGWEDDEGFHFGNKAQVESEQYKTENKNEKEAV